VKGCSRESGLAGLPLVVALAQCVMVDSPTRGGGEVLGEGGGPL